SRLVMASLNLEGVGFTTNSAPPLCGTILARFSNLPGVEAAGLVDHQPFGGERGELVTDLVRLHEGTRVRHTTMDVGPQFFTTMGIPLAAGRDVTEGDFFSGNKVALVNETFVQIFWPNQSVLGWQVQKLRGQKFEVIGVVRDARLENPAKAPRPTVY